jgi:hypothetical protein
VGDKRVSGGIAITVTVVWAISFLADIVMTTYEPSPLIHAIMLTVAGAAVADLFRPKEK